MWAAGLCVVEGAYRVLQKEEILPLDGIVLLAAEIIAREQKNGDARPRRS